MKFIGNLFLRKLLALKVIGKVVYELIGSKYAPPGEHKIECVCELLTTIGHGLENQDHQDQGMKLMDQFTGRLKELKATKIDGKAAYPRRVQFKIQDLLDLRENSWHLKMFKEIAKTTDQIREAASRETWAKKGQDTMFSTQIAGRGPDYIDRVLRDAAKRTNKVVEPTRVEWGIPYVKRLLSYFSDDRDVKKLEESWKEAAPNATEVRLAIETFFDVGRTDKTKGEAVAEAVSELLSRRCYSWEVLESILTPFLVGLEEEKMDNPFVDQFVHALLARLFHSFGKDFNKSVLMSLPKEQDDCYWRLLCRSLKRLRESYNTDAVRKAVANVPMLMDHLINLSGANAAQMNRKLQEEGCL